MRELKRVQWIRIARVNVVWKKDQDNAISGNQKDGVREEIIAVLARLKKRAKSTPNPLLPLNHRQKRMVEVRRGKRTLRGQSPSGSSLDSSAKITKKVFAPNNLVIIGNVNSINLNRAANSVRSARSHTGSLKGNLAKSLKRVMTKVQWQNWKMFDSWVVYRRMLSRFGTYPTSTIHKSCAASCKHPRRSVAE